jgi:hypothetical protein
MSNIDWDVPSGDILQQSLPVAASQQSLPVAASRAAWIRFLWNEIGRGQHAGQGGMGQGGMGQGGTG